MQAKQFFPLLCFLIATLHNVTATHKHCKKVTGPSSKHAWKIEQFLGDFDGIELHAFNDEAKSFEDTCMRVQISEVNEMGEGMMITNSSDLYNFSLALRHLKLNFYFNTVKVSYQVTLNMSNIGYWSNGDVTVQVLRRDESQLLIAICEHDKFYAVLLSSDSTNKLQVGTNINTKLLEIKKLIPVKTVKLDVECEAPANIIKDQQSSDNNNNDVSSTGKLNFSLTTFVLATLIFKFFI